MIIGKAIAIAGLVALAAVGVGEAGVVAYPEYPAAIERDHAYAVRVVQGGESLPLTVYNHCEKSALRDRTHGGDVNRRFCEFAFSGASVRVEIRVAEDVRAYKVFPARHRLRSEFHEGVISVWLEKPLYFGIQLNDSDKSILSIFADRPEDPAKIPAKDKPGVMYVEGWKDAPTPAGVIETGKEIREIYIAPGAVLNARLKICGANTFLHGRGMVLDPLSDVFRYDQTKNTARGVVVNSAPGVVVEDIKIIDARTFNFISWGNDSVYRNIKAMASMMCTDGLTNGGRNLLVENAWLYVGDNAIVVSGVREATYRNVAIGTSCAAIFPQDDNYGVRLEDIDVFRADDGLINNSYNGVLRRNNKWNEMNGGKAKKELGPQDLTHRHQQFHFRRLTATDCTLFSHFFHGHNMGRKPKTFAFDGCSIPFSTGSSSWRSIGKADGVAIDTHNDSKRWLDTDNYHFAFTNLWIGGKRARFAEKAVRDPEGGLSIDYAESQMAMQLPLAADRHEVNWKCPYKVTMNGRLLRDWRKASVEKGAQEIEVGEMQANLVAETHEVRSVWQRVPSWLVKFEATGRENGKVIYRLVQCERNAGIQATVTDDFLVRGNGKWRFAFDYRAESETGADFKIKVSLSSNEKRFEEVIPAEAGTEWKHREVTLAVDFDRTTTDLVSLGILLTEPTDSFCLKDMSLVKVQ